MKEFCLSNCWKAASMGHGFMNVGERSLVIWVGWSFDLGRLSILGNLVFNVFRTSCLTADPLGDAVDRIINEVFNILLVIQVIALVITKVFDRVWHADLVCKYKSYRISSWVSGLILTFLSYRRVWGVLKNLKKALLIWGFQVSGFLDQLSSFYSSFIFLTIILLHILLLQCLILFLGT